MKSNESQSTLNESKLLIQASLLDSKSWEKPLCPGKNQATHLCLNPKCEALNGKNQKTGETVRNFFICSNDKCQVCCSPNDYSCAQNKKQKKSERAHQKCYIGDYKRILFCIQLKKKDSLPLKESINKIFDNFIDYLSELRQRYLDELKYYGLSLNQQKFLSCFNKRQFEQITPELICQVVKQLHNQVEDDVLKIKKTLEKYWKKQEVKAKEIFELIGKNFQRDHLSMDSKIVVSEKEQLDLIKILEDQQEKSVNELSLLYRASQNDFGAKKFHQKCELIEHTVVVIQTEYGKKIGGYTPIVWDGKKNGYQRDSSGKSFIFSLTNNHKFTLLKTQEQNAIYQHSSYGPIFGGNHDILIKDKGNTNNCQASCGTSYTHPEYQHDQTSWTKFSGAIGTHEFKVKEWQVFQVKWS